MKSLRLPNVRKQSQSSNERALGTTDIDGKQAIPCEYEWIDYARNGKI